MNFVHKRWLIATALFGAVMVMSLPTSAQPGDGVRSSGGWELTPRITLSGAYDTNVFRAAPDEAMPVVDAPILSVEPGVSINSPDARTFRLSFDGSAQWEQYFGEQQTGAGVIDVSNQSGLSTAINIGGHLNPEGDLSLKIDENFRRLNEPPPAGTSQPYNWITNRLGATVGIHPGARILTLDLGYHWQTYNFQSANLEALDRNVHQFEAIGQWNFLPKTSVLVQANYDLVRWSENIRQPSRDDVGAPDLINADSNPLRVKGGLRGLLTNRIALRALAGYGSSMHDPGPSFEGVIGEAAIGYTFGRLSLENSLELGYRRDFGDSTIGNYFSLHEVFTNYEQGLWDRMVTLYLGGRFQIRDYSSDVDLSQLGVSSLNDELLIGKAGVRTNLDDWLIVDLGYSIRANFTDDQFTVDAVDPTDPSLAVLREYTQHIITLSTTFQY